MVSRLECSVCFNDFDDFQHLPQLLDECKHTFCYQCLCDWIKRSNTTCPMCRAPINMSVDIPTNLEILEVYEKKKLNPKCNCHESRMYFCPTCLAQNYVDWEERRESREHAFCIGCACNHFHDTAHQVQNLNSNQSDVIMDIISPNGDLEDGSGEKSGRCRVALICIGIGMTLTVSISLTVAVGLFFNVLPL